MGLPFYCRTRNEGRVYRRVRMLEHMVDTVLYFEGDKHHTFRILRAVKNRFGSTNEIGILKCRHMDWLKL